MPGNASDWNNAWTRKKTHVRDKRLGGAPVTPGAVEPLPQVSSQAHCLRHARPELIPGKTSFEYQSRREKALQKVFRIVLGPHRHEVVKKFVLVERATRDTPSE